MIVLCGIRRDSTVGLFCARNILPLFLRKNAFSPEMAIKTKAVEKVTNIWYNILAYPARSVKQKSNTRKEITENDQKRNR